MKSKPILFSAPMVRAMLSGKKTQTRRIVKLPKKDGVGSNRFVFVDHDGKRRFIDCPYGERGTALWVRKTWKRACGHNDDDTICIAYAASQQPNTHNLLVNNIQRPEGVMLTEWKEDLRWRPSIHMPRWASRITLEVVSVRVERLNEISERDAITEGIEPHAVTGLYRNYLSEGGGCLPIASFASLWASINGVSSWSENPWVWVISFCRREHENGRS